MDRVNQEALDRMLREGARLIDFDQIPGLRAQCRALSYDVACSSIAGVVGTEILDRWCAAAEQAG